MFFLRKFLFCFSWMLLAGGSAFSEESDFPTTFQVFVGHDESTEIHPFSSSQELHDFVSSYEEKYLRGVPKDFKLQNLLRQARMGVTSHGGRAEIISDLSHFLRSGGHYITFQEAVLEIVANTLYLLGEDRAAHIDFASHVYEEVAHFLRKYRKDDDDMYFKSIQADQVNDVQGCARDFVSRENIEDSDVKNNHGLLLYLTKKLRRLVHLETRDLVHEARDFMAEKLRDLEVEEASEEELKRAVEYLSIHWIHGTRAYTLKSAQCDFEGELLPSGELKRRQSSVLSGARDSGSGATGVNRLHLSGTELNGIKSVMYYASKSGVGIDQEVETLDTFLNQEYHAWERLLDHDGRVSRFVGAVRNVERYKPEVFEKKKEKVFSKLFEIYDLIENTFKNRPSEIFNHWDDYYISKFYSAVKAFKKLEQNLLNPISERKELSEEDQHLLSLPVIIGSMSCYGAPLSPLSYSNPEYLVSGGLKLGRDLQVVFVQDQHFDEVEELVHQLGLADSVKVETARTLGLVDLLNQYFRSSIEDVYGLHDQNPSRPTPSVVMKKDEL